MHLAVQLTSPAVQASRHLIMAAWAALCDESAAADDVVEATTAFVDVDVCAEARAARAPRTTAAEKRIVREGGRGGMASITE